MKRMLFNATQSEELRVAIVDGQKLIDLDIETVGKEQRKSNIYKGRITRIEPSLEAAFVDYGADRHGFLPFKEVSRAYFAAGVDPHRARIQDALSEGMELIVQVDKDERGNKGAALTTYISLAGRYLVLMPNNPRGGGVSRRIEGEDRNELKAIMDNLDVPSGMSMISRTAAVGRTQEELQWDMDYLLQLWTAIEDASREHFGLIYQESSLVIRAIRDYFQPDIGELLIDTESLFEQARQFMMHVMPANVNRVKFYQDDVPLFSRFQIEHQIETAYRRDVSLPSGGAIVIDHTEALVSVDVNSARATRGSDIETTAFNTNCEAADEIARQLRLRDLGGLIVIDFIDMESQKNQREVEKRLADALHHDRARVQVGKISRFGLLELSRQRLQPSLGETAHMPCPRCHGTGFIRGTESSALHILRILQEEAMKENSASVNAQVPVDVATFLLNEKRAEIYEIEARLKVSVVLIPNIHLETPNYTISRLRHDELNSHEDVTPSYKLMDLPVAPEVAKEAERKKIENRPQPAVKHFAPSQPAPASKAEAKKPGLLSRLFKWIVGEPEVLAPVKPAPRNTDRNGRNGQRNDRNRNDRGNRGERPAATDDAKPAEGRGERPARNSRPDRNEERTDAPAGNGRGRRPDNRGERDPQAPRNANPNGNPNARNPAPANGNAEPRQERAPRPPRGERTDRNADRNPDRNPERNEAKAETRAVEEGAPRAEEVNGNVAESETRSSSRRRRSRRSDRGNRNGGNAVENARNENSENAVSAPSEHAPRAVPAQNTVVAPSPAFVPNEVVLAAQVAAAPLAPAPAPVEPAPAPVAVAPVVVEVVSAPVVPVAPAPIASAPVVVAVATPGLELVTTKVVDAPVAVEEAAPSKRAPRRRRPAAPLAVNEPLQLVETGAASVAQAVTGEVDAPVAPARRSRRKPKAEASTQEQLQLVETQAARDTQAE